VPVVQAQHPTQRQKQGDLPAKEERLQTPLFLWEVLVVLSGALDRGCKAIEMVVCEYVMSGNVEVDVSRKSLARALWSTQQPARKFAGPPFSALYPGCERP
jgi:hypothetical protein